MPPTEWVNDEDLTPCAACDKPFENPIVRVVDVNVAVFDRQAVRDRVGLTVMLGSPKLAAVMGPGALLKLNVDPDGKTRLLICNHCYCEDLNIAELVEKVVARRREAVGEVPNG